MHLPDHSHFAAVLQQPRRRSASTHTLLGAWRQLWRSAPADVRRDTIILVVFIPAMLAPVVFLWVMLP